MNSRPSPFTLILTFASSEPLFHHQADALQIFRQWVVYKIISGSLDTFYAMGVNTSRKPQNIRTRGCDFYSRARDRTIEYPDWPVAPSELLMLLEEWAKAANRTRCVLLLDDAAHAFSPEQQRDFFEIFRALAPGRLPQRLLSIQASLAIRRISTSVMKRNSWRLGTTQTMRNTLPPCARYFGTDRLAITASTIVRK